MADANLGSYGADPDLARAIDTILRDGKHDPSDRTVQLARRYLRACVPANTHARALLLLAADNLDAYRQGMWSSATGIDEFEPVTTALYALRDALDAAGLPHLARPRTPVELDAIARRLGVRADWHEPDEQDVHAQSVTKPQLAVTDGSFDNAGHSTLEQMVLLYQDRVPVAEVALATLFAWACDAAQAHDRQKIEPPPSPAAPPPSDAVDIAVLERVLVDQLGKHTAQEVLSALHTEPTGAPAEAPAEAPALVWESAGTDEPGDQHASSTLRVHPESTSAHYSLGPAYAAPDVDGERWSVELVQVRHGERVAATDLGVHPTEQDAKDHAQQWERDGLVGCAWYTVTNHWALIPLPELMAAAREETDPDEYVTDDAQLTPHAMTGRAEGSFSDLLERYETVSDQRVVECGWGEAS